MSAARAPIIVTKFALVTALVDGGELFEIANKVPVFSIVDSIRRQDSGRGDCKRWLVYGWEKESEFPEATRRVQKLVETLD